MVGQKAMTFGPSAQAAGRPGCGPTAARRSRVVAARRRQRRADVDRPADPRPRHRPGLRRPVQPQPARPASPRRRRSQELRERGEDKLADMLAVDGPRRARARASTSTPSATCCCSCSRSTSRPSLLGWLQGFVLNARRAEHRLPDAPGRRGQDQPAAAGLLRPLAARRAAQPGHQRHRQRQPDPAADDEPAADLAADRGRGAGDDVLDLAAAGADRAGLGAGVAAASPGRS